MDLIAKFKEDLYNTPKAIQYLKEVRCFDDTDIEKFELGFCKDDIKKFAPGTDLCWLVNRIVIPLRDQYGNIVSYAGRALSNTVKPKIINTSYAKHSFLYALNIAKEEIYKQNCVILAEGQFDVVSCFKHDLANAVGICGSAFSARQGRILLRYANRAIILGDGDVAGKKAAARAESVLKRLYFQTSIIYPPEGIKDADDVLKSEFASEYIKEIKEWMES